MNLKCEKYDEYLSSLLIQYNPNPPIILIADHLQIRTASCCDRLILSENLSILLTPWWLIGNRHLFLTSYSEREPLLESDPYYSPIIYLLKANNRNTRIRCVICFNNKDTRVTPMANGVVLVFLLLLWKHISLLVLVFLIVPTFFPFCVIIGFILKMQEVFSST